MRVHIERIKRLFPKDVCEKMLKIPNSFGTCAYNSAMSALENLDYDIRYCEGWINDDMGHAFNKLVKEDGSEHYFDLSQEYIKFVKHENGGLKDVDFECEFPSAIQVWRTFEEDKEAHLITVPTWRGMQTYGELKKRGLQFLCFD